VFYYFALFAHFVGNKLVSGNFAKDFGIYNKTDFYSLIISACGT